MHGLRITRLVLLSVAALFALIALLAPVAHTAVAYGPNGSTANVEEVYTLWGVERQLEGATSSVGFGPLDAGWYDGGLDNTGGITYLRMAAPLFVVAVLAIGAALLLTLLNGTGDGRSAGIVAAAGFVVGLIAIVMHGAGLTLRADAVFGRADIAEAMFVGYLAALMLLLLLLAALFGMISTSQSIHREVIVETHSHDAHDHHDGETWADADDAWGEDTWDAPLKYFRCTGCGTVAGVHAGQQPTCEGCGNASPLPS